MADAVDFLKHAVVVGVGATVLMDIWTLARTRLFGIPALDYALVGRWLGHMVRGHFRHENIAASPAMPRERPIGWIAHYLTGIAFAAMLLAIWGVAWVRQPALGPALLVGIGSVAAPFFLMQPAMGAGIAASRTPNPAAARINSLITHGVFGFGLYAGGWMAKLVA